MRCRGRLSSALEHEKRNASHLKQRLHREHTTTASGVLLPLPTAELGCVNQTLHALYKKEYLAMERAGRSAASRQTLFSKHPITTHHILIDYCETAKQASDAVCEDEELLKRFANLDECAVLPGLAAARSRVRVCLDDARVCVRIKCYYLHGIPGKS